MPKKIHEFFNNFASLFWFNKHNIDKKEFLNNAALAAIVESSEDAIIGRTLEGTISSWNQGAEHIYGYTREEALGQPITLIFPEGYEEEFQMIISKLRAGERIDPYETRRKKRDGSVIPVSISISPIRDYLGDIIGASSIARDISERKRAEETIRYQAFHDALTKLPNRRFLEDQIREVIENAQKNSEAFAVLFLDIDRFKGINDTLGHDVGDKLLLKIADRLKENIRKEDFLGRFGSDTFAIVLTNIHSSDNAIGVVRKIFKAMKLMFSVESYSFHASLSMGIAMFPQDGTSPGMLFRNADTALYRAKELGRERYQMYNEGLRLRFAEKMALESQLRLAESQGGFTLHFQPIIDLKTRGFMGAEALTRWRHPTLGLIYPANFIPLAEESGIILRLGDWVLRALGEQNRLWKQQGMEPFTISVNVSPRQFSQANFIPRLDRLIKENHIDSRLLILEITEAVAMMDIDLTMNKLVQLKKMGLRIAIDDFGTGYSSLNYLKRFPVDILKIDKSFLMPSLLATQDAAIIHAIISMAHSLGMKVTAEGVETKEQMDFLASLSCDYAQGFEISKPRQADDLTRWIKGRDFRETLVGEQAILS